MEALKKYLTKIAILLRQLVSAVQGLVFVIGGDQANYFARVYRSSNQTIATSTPIKVQFDVKSHDPENLFDLTTNYRWVCPSAGFYQIAGQIRWNAPNSASRYLGMIYKNGAEFIVSEQQCDIAGLYITNVFSDCVYLNKCDYLELNAYQDSGQDKTILGTSASTYLSISKISKEVSANTISSLFANGWNPAEETWTYAGADDPTFTFTISGDKTTKYSAGMRIKLTQTTDKYFIITKVAYSVPNTTITVYGGTDYDLANAAITSPYYSREKAPFGFPLDPSKWTVITTSTSYLPTSSPANGTWYNPGGLNISIPIGVWLVSYQTKAGCNGGSTGQSLIATSLSTSSSSESDASFSADQYFTTNQLEVNINKHKYLILTSKTTYYLIMRTRLDSMTNIFVNGGYSPITIMAVCAYL